MNLTKRIYKASAAFAAAVIAFVSLAMLPLTASAQAHGYFHIPDGAVKLGEEFSVTVEFTSDESIGSAQASVSYNETYMEFLPDKSDYSAGGGGIITINAYPSGDTDNIVVTLTFAAKSEGVSQMNLVNGAVLNADGEAVNNQITAYAYITIAQYADTSGDTSYENDTSSGTELAAVLGSLEIAAGELKPDFSPGIYDYTVTVPHDTITFEIEAEPENVNDTIWISGALYLVDGKNQRTVTVTSADGLSSNVYTITIYREADENGSDIDNASDEASDGGSDSDTGADVISSEVSSEDSSSVPSSEDSSSLYSAATESVTTGVEDLRNALMPALYVAMAVILLAVIILIVWIRMKIKESGITRNKK